MNGKTPRDVLLVILLCAAAGVLLSQGRFAQAELPAVSAPVVLELYTSQSCSSCPPADKILAQLAQQSNVIALGCHVTYWDHLYWKDRFSQEVCTDRQHDYAQSAGRSRVFTPELIINGRSSIVGSDQKRISDVIESQQGQIAPVKIVETAKGYTVQLPTVATSGATISYVRFAAAEMQSMKSGENAGRSVHYTNPVRSINVLTHDWRGDAKVIQLPLEKDATGGFAILAHLGPRTTGPVLAAGQFIFSRR